MPCSWTGCVYQCWGQGHGSGGRGSIEWRVVSMGTEGIEESWEQAVYLLWLSHTNFQLMISTEFSMSPCLLRLRGAHHLSCFPLVSNTTILSFTFLQTATVTLFHPFHSKLVEISHLLFGFFSVLWPAGSNPLTIFLRLIYLFTYLICMSVLLACIDMFRTHARCLRMYPRRTERYVRFSWN